MANKQLAAKIDVRIKNALDRFCNENGLIMSRFLEEAILDKIEEKEDLSDLRKLRKETYRDLDAVMGDLKKSGKL